MINGVNNLTIFNCENELYRLSTKCLLLIRFENNSTCYHFIWLDRINFVIVWRICFFFLLNYNSFWLFDFWFDKFNLLIGLTHIQRIWWKECVQIINILIFLPFCVENFIFLNVLPMSFHLNLRTLMLTFS